jgi:hypothetical protein
LLLDVGSSAPYSSILDGAMTVLVYTVLVLRCCVVRTELAGRNNFLSRDAAVSLLCPRKCHAA